MLLVSYGDNTKNERLSHMQQVHSHSFNVSVRCRWFVTRYVFFTPRKKASICTECEGRCALEQIWMSEDEITFFFCREKKDNSLVAQPMTRSLYRLRHGTEQPGSVADSTPPLRSEVSCVVRRRVLNIIVSFM